MILGNAQRAIYEMDRAGEHGTANIAGDVFFKYPVTEEEIKSAVESLVKNCDILRIRISEMENGPMQEIQPYTVPTIRMAEFDDEEAYVKWVEEQACEPVDIYGCLYCFAVVKVYEKYGLFFRLHHIVGDAWSMSLCCEYINDYLKNKKETEMPSYEEHIEDEQTYLNGKRYEKDNAYWLDVYSENSEPSYFSEKTVKFKTARRFHAELSVEESESISVYSRKNDISEYAVFMSALAVCYSRLTGADKFYIGTPVLNRDRNKDMHTVGTYINTIPLSITIDKENIFNRIADEVKKQVMQGFRHKKYSYSELLSEIRTEGGSTDGLYDVMLSYQNTRMPEDTEVHWYCGGSQNESLQIHIDDRNNEGRYHIDYDYQTEKFSESDIARFHEHLMNVLLGGISAPEKRISELTILSPEEYDKVVYSFNDTAVDYPKEKTIDRLFVEQVRRTPDKTAVIACDRTLTYAQLDEESNRVANGLIAKGVKTGDMVALMLPRTSRLIVSIFGILKSGGVYLPVDPGFSVERKEYILRDSKTKYVIADNEEQFSPDRITRVKFSELQESTNTYPNVNIDSGSACYCIYTSGSTGEPKGTVITHRCLNNFCNNNNNNYQTRMLNIGNNVIATIQICFDVSVFEIFLSLLNGLKVVLADESSMNSGDKIGKLIRKHDIDIIHATPTKIQMYMRSRIFCDSLKRIKIMMIGAEIFTDNLLKTLRQYTKAIIYNGYGPSETTIGVTFGEVLDRDDITIGKPIANTQIYILDKYLHPVPIGVEGELCIAGDCVGAGYLNRPELTAEKFIADPFGPGKMYRSGDIAKWREDGNIEYIGRNDFQVKIRGLRIELGEIENAISSVDGITQAVVIVRRDSTGRQLICAFYTGRKTEASVIRQAIAKRLPRYMLPHIFTHLDSMPMTPSGKVNRRALPEVDLENIGSGCEYVSPRNETERKLCELVAATLKAEKVGIDDDFFDLGGDSLKVIELVSKAHADGIFFNLQNVFDCPTVRQLCEYMGNEDKPHNVYKMSDFDEIHKLIASNADTNFTPEKIEVGDVLITGSTGFLGMHILAEYLETESGKAYCLVRGEDEADAKQRLEKLLQYYFDGRYLDFVGKRILILCGDVQKENLGLATIPKVQTVINAAASVKHYGSYKYFYDINVGGTKHAMQTAKKANAKFIQISTLSVSGNSMVDVFEAKRSEEAKTFTECDLYIGQELDNVYIRSKFEAEKAVFDEMLNGLQANIIRVGNLTNRANDLKFQPNYESNAFLNRVKAVIDLGAIPDYLIPLYCEFSPIDDTAKAVMSIARHFNSHRNVFHVNSQKVVYFDKLIEYLKASGIDISVLSSAEFSKHLSAAANDEKTRHIYEALINDMDENSNLVYDSNIHIQNESTLDYFVKTGFDWSKIDGEYIGKYVDYFRKVGYFYEFKKNMT